MIDIGVYELKNETDVSLDPHFVTGFLIPETVINILYESVDVLQGLVSGRENNKGQIIALLKRRDVIFIDLTSFRSDQTAGKNDIRHRVRDVAGNLTDAVKDIPIDKNTVACIERDVFFSDLIIQCSGFSRCDLKSGMPVQGPAPLYQRFQLILIECDRKDRRIVRDLLFQLMIYGYWHNFPGAGVQSIKVDSL